MNTLPEMVGEGELGRVACPHRSLSAAATRVITRLVKRTVAAIPRWLTLLVSLCVAHMAMAQDFPSRPVRMVSGPGPDVAARIVAHKLAEFWGQQVVTETLPAASGKVAAETVFNAPPNGYTLLNATSSFLISRALGVNTVDLALSMSPIALTNVLPFVLVVPASSPARTTEELIRLARARPGQLNYASGGNGTLPHLAAELFKRTAQIDIVHVPFKSADQAMLAVVAGQVDMMITSYPVAGPQARAGKVRLLAVTSARRALTMPDLPTLTESGLPGYDLVSWTALFAPPGTPGAIMQKLRADVDRAVRSPDLRQQYGTLGFEPPPEDLVGEKLDAFLRADTARWTRLVRDSGAKVD